MKKIELAIAICGIIAGFAQAGDRKGTDTSDAIAVDVKQFKYLVAPQYQSAFGYNREEAKAFWYTNGVGEVAVAIPEAGEYEIRLQASGDSALNERAKFKFGFAGKAVGPEVTLKTDSAADYTFTVKAAAGEHKLTVEFTNDDHKEGEYDRNLYVHAVTLSRMK